MNVTQKIVQNIKSIMESQDVTPYSLAKRAEMSEGSLRAMLSGKTESIMTGNLERMADALDCDVEVFLRPRKGGTR